MTPRYVDRAECAHVAECFVCRQTFVDGDAVYFMPQPNNRLHTIATCWDCSMPERERHGAALAADIATALALITSDQGVVDSIRAAVDRLVVELHQSHDVIAYFVDDLHPERAVL